MTRRMSFPIFAKINRMPQQYYFLKLIPSRADFATTMTPEELAIMQQHVMYWKIYLDNGHAVAYGPVMDPAGVYGVGIIAMDTEAELLQFIADDPASAINQYEYFPMSAMTAAPGGKG